MTREDAERQIAAICKALEAETECVVESITMHDIEVSSFGDKRQMFARRVQIDLKRLPGHHWQT